MDPREKRADESWAEYGARMAGMGLAPTESYFAGPTVNQFKPTGSDYTPQQLSTPIHQLQQQNIPQNVVPITPTDTTLAGMATVPTLAGMNMAVPGEEVITPEMAAGHFGVTQDYGDFSPMMGTLADMAGNQPVYDQSVVTDMPGRRHVDPFIGTTQGTLDDMPTVTLPPDTQLRMLDNTMPNVQPVQQLSNGLIPAGLTITGSLPGTPTIQESSDAEQQGMMDRYNKAQEFANVWGNTFDPAAFSRQQANYPTDERTRSPADVLAAANVDDFSGWNTAGLRRAGLSDPTDGAIPDDYMATVLSNANMDNLYASNATIGPVTATRQGADWVDPDSTKFGTDQLSNAPVLSHDYLSRDFGLEPVSGYIDGMGFPQHTGLRYPNQPKTDFELAQDKQDFDLATATAVDTFANIPSIDPNVISKSSGFFPWSQADSFVPSDPNPIGQPMDFYDPSDTSSGGGSGMRFGLTATSRDVYAPDSAGTTTAEDTSDFDALSKEIQKNYENYRDSYGQPTDSTNPIPTMPDWSWGEIVGPLAGIDPTHFDRMRMVDKLSSTGTLDVPSKHTMDTYAAALKSSDLVSSGGSKALATALGLPGIVTASIPQTVGHYAGLYGETMPNLGQVIDDSIEKNVLGITTPDITPNEFFSTPSDLSPTASPNISAQATIDDYTARQIAQDQAMADEQQRYVASTVPSVPVPVAPAYYSPAETSVTPTPVAVPAGPSAADIERQKQAAINERLAQQATIRQQQQQQDAARQEQAAQASAAAEAQAARARVAAAQEVQRFMNTRAYQEEGAELTPAMMDALAAGQVDTFADIGGWAGRSPGAAIDVSDRGRGPF